MDVTQVIAGYGAVVSTVAVGMTVALGIQQFRDRHPRIRVSPKLGQMQVVPAVRFSEARPGTPPPSDVALRFKNLGHGTVTLDALGFVLPDDRHFTFDQARRTVEFPYPLPEGQACWAWWPIGDFARRLRDHGFTGKIRLIGYCMDQADNTFRSKPFEFDVDAWGTEATS